MRDSSNYAKNTVMGSILTRMAPFIKVNGIMTREKGGGRSFTTMEMHFRACSMSRAKKALPNGIRGMCRAK